jgi:hypothetical protein
MMNSSKAAAAWKDALNSHDSAMDLPPEAAAWKMAMEPQIAQLPSSITPWELQGLTDGQVNLLGNIETGAKQAAENAKEKAKEIIGNTIKLLPPQIDMIRKGHWPTFLMPQLIEEMEIEEREEKKRKMLT